MPSNLSSHNSPRTRLGHWQPQAWKYSTAMLKHSGPKMVAQTRNWNIPDPVQTNINGTKGDDETTLIKDNSNKPWPYTTTSQPSTSKHTHADNHLALSCTLFSSYTQQTNIISPLQLTETVIASLTYLTPLQFAVILWLRKATTSPRTCVGLTKWVYLQRMPRQWTIPHPWQLSFVDGKDRDPQHCPTFLSHWTHHFFFHHHGNGSSPWQIHQQPQLGWYLGEDQQRGLTVFTNLVSYSGFSQPFNSITTRFTQYHSYTKLWWNSEKPSPKGPCLTRFRTKWQHWYH